MIDWIDTAHRFRAGLFFDDMRDQSGGARDHENAVERRRIHPQIGEDRADGSIHVNWKRFLRGGERFLNRSRRLHVPGGELATLSGVLALTIPVNATSAAAALGAVAVMEHALVSPLLLPSGSGLLSVLALLLVPRSGFPKPHAREWRRPECAGCH